MGAVQAVFALRFSAMLRRSALPNILDEECPFVSILLPLRGADSGLERSVKRMLTQDYPNYEVRAIIDNENDPAWSVVNEVGEQLKAENLVVSTIIDRKDTCSFQNSALSQAVNELDERCEVVVIADGDLAPHATCLRELVAPFRDSTIGATFGNRWFMPRTLELGSWIRYLWNAGAVVPMCVLNIPWGGCFAIRRYILEESGLAKSWETAMVQDAPAKTALIKHGLRLAFVPTLMMVNQDRCGVPFAFDFMKRQMLWTRLYHPNFATVFLHASTTTIVILTAIALAVKGLVDGDTMTVVWIVSALTLYVSAMMIFIQSIERGIRHILSLRGTDPVRYPIAAILRMPFAIIATQFVYFSAILLATFRNRVTWRGVTYTWKGPYDVTVVNNQPFSREQQTANASQQSS